MAWLLAGAASLELGGFLAVRSDGPIPGFQVKPPAWSYAAALSIAGAYSALTRAGDAAARGEVEVLSPLKFLALAAAVIAGVFEEALFRGRLMDGLARAGRGRPLQVLLSGLAFGGLHFTPSPASGLQ